MPKTPSNKLFELIKSLSGSEKRYFKIFANKGDTKANKYIQLFDAIHAQSTFDEAALKREIYQNKPIHSRKYSELKAYLYDLILKSLQAYDEKSSIEYRLKGMLLSVRSLYKRSHFEACHDVLYKARKLSKKYEAFHILLEILRWEKEIAYAQTNISYLDEELERIDEEEKWCLERLANISAYRNIFFKLLVIIRKGSSFRDENRQATFKQIIDHPLLQNNKKAQCYQSKMLYYRIWSIYSYASLDWKNFHEYGKLLLESMESQPLMLKEDVSEYISALSNFISSCSVLKQYEVMQVYLEKFLHISANTSDDEFKIHRQYYLNKLELCVRTGEFEEGLQTLDSHFKQMKKFDQRSFEVSSFYINYVFIYFGVGQFGQALNYLNLWLNLPKNNERQDLQSFARILNLVIHYELGNVILLDSLLRSTNRFLKKQQQIYQYEKLMLEFIKSAIKILNKKDLNQELVELSQCLKDIEQHPIEAALLQYFDIQAWITSKINHRSFGELVREKYRTSLTSRAKEG